MYYNNTYKPDFLICDGAVQTGKTTIEIVCFTVEVFERRDQNLDYIMTGHSIGALERNVLSKMQDELGVDTSLDRNNSFRLFGNRVHCFGGKDKDDFKAIRGNSAAGHYGNEMSLQHKNTIDEVINRCTKPGARFFWETNPGNPTQYLYKHFIKKAEMAGNNREIARWPWRLRDNLKGKPAKGFLDEKTVKRIESAHTGYFYQKYVEGQWTAIEGQIYYLEALRYYDDRKLDPAFFNGAVIMGYLDPASGSQKKTGCFTNLITAARKGDDIYILDVVLRKLGVDETIGQVGESLKKYNYARMNYEDNFGQEEFVGKPLKRAFPFAPIYGQSSREDKLSRLVGMQNVVQTKVYFPERFLYETNSDGNLLLQQLCNVTKDRAEAADSDEMFLDGPDGLEGLIRSFGNAGMEGVGTKAGGQKRKELNW